ncbi:MAG TPA: PAS domain-containing protein, partial [Planctomycetota bacterium]|nr:PAS domain-containing protein [Planctomycetota bacterium]
MATHDADFLKSLAETDLMGLLFWDEKGGVTGANDAFLALVGHSREDLAAGRIDWKRMTPPEFGPLDEKAIAEMTDRGACTPFEKEYVRKDGSRVPVLIGGSRLTREPLAGVAFVIDLTDRKRADRILRESRERMSAVLETALDCIITIDERGTVLEFNPAAEKVFGYPRDAAVGRPMSELIIPPDLREAHQRGLHRFLETGEGPLLGKRVQVRAQRSDGTQ